MIAWFPIDQIPFYPAKENGHPAIEAILFRKLLPKQPACRIEQGQVDRYVGKLGGGRTEDLSYRQWLEENAKEDLLPGKLYLNGAGVEAIDKTKRQAVFIVFQLCDDGRRTGEIEDDLYYSFRYDVFFCKMSEMIDLPDSVYHVVDSRFFWYVIVWGQFTGMKRFLALLLSC
jgi:hypothetical protein